LCLDLALATTLPSSGSSRGLAADPLTHYVIVRGDLPRGMMMVQAIHASGESSPGDLTTGTHAIALSARDSAHLAETAQGLESVGLEHVRIVEDCPPYAGDLLAVGVRPGPKSVVGRTLSSLPLIRDPAPAVPQNAPQPTPAAVEKTSLLSRAFGWVFGRRSP
jgi:hypothetical protein